MNTRATRRPLFAVLVGAGLFGVVLETVLDQFEGTGLAALGLLASLAVAGAVGGYWYSRRLDAVDDPDERFQAIELRASRVSHGVLVTGVAAVAVIAVLSFVSVPVSAVLLGLLAASVVAHELSVEYYRRRM